MEAEHHSWWQRLLSPTLAQASVRERPRGHSGDSGPASPRPWATSSAHTGPHGAFWSQRVVFPAHHPAVSRQEPSPLSPRVLALLQKQDTAPTLAAVWDPPKPQHVMQTSHSPELAPSPSFCFHPPRPFSYTCSAQGKPLPGQLVYQPNIPSMDTRWFVRENQALGPVGFLSAAGGFPAAHLGAVSSQGPENPRTGWKGS